MGSFPEAYNEIHIFYYQHFFQRSQRLTALLTCDYQVAPLPFYFGDDRQLLRSPKNERLIAGYSGTPLPKLLLSAPPPWGKRWNVFFLYLAFSMTTFL